MSVTVRPCVNGGWEVDIRVQLPDGSVIRERKKAAASSKQAAQKWAESRERVLLVHGKPKPAKEDVQKIPTLNEFALRFLDGYAKANRLKPSGIASKETVLRVHLAKAFGDKRLDEISTEDVQRLKAALVERAPKTVNNVLTVLSVVLRTAVEWGVIARVPCSIKLLKAPKRSQLSTSTTSNGLWSGSVRSVGVLGRPARRRGWAAMRRDHGARVDRRRLRQTATDRGAFRMEGPCDDAERRADSVRADDEATDGRVTQARHLRGQRVLCDSEASR